MGKVSVLCIVLVFALLLEDGSSVKKKSEKEEKEDEEIQKAVNATLAEEEKKKRKDEEDKEKEKETGKEEGEDEASPTFNLTCPEVKPCPIPGICPEIEPCSPCEQCPTLVDCQPCDSCPPCKECGPCPEVKPCQPCRPCKPCGQCPVANHTSIRQDCPSPPACAETGGMSVPVALVVGAMASLLAVGVADAIGLLLRYVPPLISGFLFLAIVLMVWFFSSHYPATARELGGRVVVVLREAVSALSHRLMEAIRHQASQVSFLIFLLVLFLI
jgi:hypothetical protein